MLTVFDAIRQVAEWFKDGSRGSGPLGVPMPAKANAAPSPFTKPSPAKVDIDTFGNEDLPPRMVLPTAVVN